MKRLLRPGVDDEAAVFLENAEAQTAHEQALLTRFTHDQLRKLKSLLEPRRDDAAAEFLAAAEAEEQVRRSQEERLAKLQRVASDAPAVSAEVVAAAAAQAVIVHRLSFQEAEDDTDGSFAAEGSIGTKGSQRATMAVGDAQKTAVLRVPGFLSPAEVTAVHAAAENMIADKAAAAAGGTGEMSTDRTDSTATATALAPVRSSPAWETGRKWNVSFLHKDRKFAKELPEIRAKILELGRKADA